MMNLLFILSAIATVVTVAEILKNNGLAVEKSKTHVSFFVIQLRNFVLSSYSNQLKCLAEIMTSTVDVNDESRGRPMQKAKVRYLPQFPWTDSSVLEQYANVCWSLKPFLHQIEIVLGKTENFDELMAAAAEEMEVAAAEDGEEQG